ncbi:MAG: VCBS repeat-containing protein [Acidobacteriia bacterium]|nr:VCBS repeat-containing protein [Terriglobia bacterium]
MSNKTGKDLGLHSWTLWYVLLMMVSLSGIVGRNLLAAAIACTTPSFSVKPDFIAGATPVFVAIGDFNGDGKGDLVAVNFGSNNVSILLGKGDGTFQAAVNYGVGSDPVSVAIGDFNGDNKPDLVVVNQRDNDVSILLGKGDGSFGAAADYQAGIGPNSVVTGDFNRDGKLDFVVANQFSKSVSVFLGNGDGTFQTTSDTTLATFPSSLVAADFNGDGIADLVIAGVSLESVFILLGNGDGTFRNGPGVGAAAAIPFAAGDFNRDGTTDLAVRGPNGRVSILLGKGDGTFQAPIDSPGTAFGFVIPGDFNGDGNLDLVADSSVMLGNGDGSFRPPMAISLPFNSVFVAVGDLTGHGKRDLAAANISNDTLAILVGKGDGTFQSAVNYSTGSGPGRFWLADLNGDGIPDLSVPNRGSDTLAILLGNGDGSFRTPSTYPVGSSPVFVTAGDFNRDGKTDLVVSNFTSKDISILLGNGDGTFQASSKIAAGSNPFYIVVSDFNNDGMLDLAVVNPSQVVHNFFSQRGDVTILLGNGDGTFQPPIHNLAGTNPGASAVTGDFNGDGIPDLAVIDSGNSVGGLGFVALLRGNGDGTFQDAGSIEVGISPGQIAVGDFNGDGILDLAVGRSFMNLSGSVVLLRGNGDGTFQAPVSFGDISSAGSLAIGDFNGDGKLDLAVANLNSSVSILLGNGDGTLQNPVDYSLGISSAFIGVSDINGDGKPDVVAPDAVLLNSCPAANAQIAMNLIDGGAQSVFTREGAGFVQAGYVTVDVGSGSGLLVGTAVFSLEQNGHVVTEAGVPVSPPTTAARIFIDYRTSVPSKSDHPDAASISIDTGFALVNPGGNAANVSFTLRDAAGQLLASGHSVLAAGTHLSKFIDQLHDVAPDFQLAADFPTVTKFGSLEIGSDQPLSIVALRLTTNQRGETLITTTPIADLTKTASETELFFAHVVDGGGYQSTVVLLNTSGLDETGNIQLFADDGAPRVVRPVIGNSGSSFAYTIKPGGIFVLQTDGSPPTVNSGWIRVTANQGSQVPVGAGIFGLTQGGILVTESGIPSALPTNHARIYIDKSNGHDTGLAIAFPQSGADPIALSAFHLDGRTPAGKGLAFLNLNANGHAAMFVGELISDLPDDFKGVLDMSAPASFVALTMRSLNTARGDFLLTTFPVADLARPVPFPIIFPQIADGGGYQTQFIFLNIGTEASVAALSFFGDDGSPLAVGKSSR